MIIIMNTCVYNSCIIRATPASSIRVDDNCAQVASDSANYERPMCRSKHACRSEYENDGKWPFTASSLQGTGKPGGSISGEVYRR